MATTVKFGTVAATDVTVVSATEITCKVPAGSGTVGVTVTTDAGENTKANAFTYEAAAAAPVVTDVDPDTADAGDTATVTGTDLG